jgi:Ran GTPase-activating protein (RanGAP) involved in mRNA processing and transport
MEHDAEPSTAIPRLQQNDPDLYLLDFGGRAKEEGKLLSAQELTQVGSALRTNTRLRKLSLRHHNLRWNEKDDSWSLAFEDFLAALDRNRGLTELDLSYNPSLLCDPFLDHCLNLLRFKNHTLCSLRLLDPETQRSDDDDHSTVPPTVTRGLIDLVEYVGELNHHPIQLKEMAYRARTNDATLFAFECFHDPSDVKVYTVDSMRIIVEALASNDNIRTLRLDRCCPGVHGVEVLKETIVKNPYLTKLSLANNLLTPQAASIIAEAIRSNPRTHLESLDLSDNLLDDEAADALSDLLASNETLRVVKVEGNPKISTHCGDRLRNAAAFNCEPPGLKRIAHRIKKNDPTLTVVDMRGTPLTSERGPAKGYYTNLGAKTLAELLESNSSIHTIQLCHNHVGPDGAKALGARLQENPYITSLDISHNPLTDEGLKHLVIALQHNDALSECVVAGCEGSERLYKEIQALTRLNCQPLPIKALLSGSAQAELSPEKSHILDLSVRESQPLGKWPSLRSSSAPYVLKILRDNPQFTELNLKGNRNFGDAGVEQLCEFFSDNIKCKLTRINLIDTGITDTTIHSLCVAMKSNYRLRTILTQGNPSLTTKPAQALEDALSLNAYAPAVKDLVPLLQRNTFGIDIIRFGKFDVVSPDGPLGDDTVRIVAQSLATNNHVKTVELNGQGISNRGVGYLCDILTEGAQGYNQTITSLDLSHNCIGPDGAKLIAEMLEKNTTLKTLKLHGNKLQEYGVLAILQALKVANRSIVSLTLHETECNPTTLRQINALVAANGQHVEFRAEVLQRLTVLKEVKHVGSVEDGFLGNSGIQALQQGLEATPTHNITSIELRNNSFSIEGIRSLCKIIADNSKIQKLVLRDNNPGSKMETSTNNGNSTLLVNDNQRDLDASMQSTASSSMRSPSRMRPWDFALVNSLLFDCIESCPWLTELEVTEGELSVLAPHVEAALGLNSQTQNFRSYYRRIRDGRDKQGQLIVPQGIDIPSENLTRKSLDLLFNTLLLQFPQSLANVRLINFGNNELNDSAVTFLADILKSGVFPKLQSLYLDNNVDIGADGAAALRDFVWTSDEIIIVSIQGTRAEKLNVAFAECSLANPASEEVALAGSSIASMLTKLGVNKDRLGPEKALVMTLSQRRVKPSAGNPFKSDQSLDVERTLQDEAFAGMPARKKYVRGQYLGGGATNTSTSSQSGAGAGTPSKSAADSA